MRKMFDFGEIGYSKAAVNRTWIEFRDALKNREFAYDEIEKAKSLIFLRVLNDLFSEHKGIEILSKTISDLPMKKHPLR